MRLKLMSCNLVVSLLLCVITPHFSSADDEDALKYFRQGEEYLSSRKYEQAISQYRKALNENSSSGTITITTETVKMIPYGRTLKREVVRDYNTHNYFPERRIAEIEETLQQLAKRVEEEALPCNLTINNIRFSDRGGISENGALDAGEDAKLVAVIENNGSGSSFGTVLEISTDTGHIKLDNDSVRIGDIPPGGSREISIPLKSDFDLTSGKATISLIAKERRGFDSKKLPVRITTACLEKPKLEIAFTEISDSNTGLARGNDNGIPENGETIEVTAFIRNNGVGKSLSSRLIGRDLTRDIEWTQQEADLGDIPPGETVKAKLAFKIPRTFSRSEISSLLQATDVRNIGNTEKKDIHAVVTSSPQLHLASSQITFNKVKVDSLTNGEKYEAELRIENRGKIDAKNVVVEVTAPDGVELSRTSFNLGDIKRLTTSSKQRFEFTLPRIYSEKKLPLKISISQNEFSSEEASLSVAVSTKAPLISYIVSVKNDAGGSALAQGGHATLTVQVNNEGDLPAEGVRIKLKSRDENLKVMGRGEAEVTIGRINAQESNSHQFKIESFRRIKPGQTPVEISITQNDFNGLKEMYALNIHEESEEVIDLASDFGSRTSGRYQAASQSGPIIKLKSKIAETTTEESIRLVFDIEDSKSNIDSSFVNVKVDGIKIQHQKISARPEKKKQLVVDVPLKEGNNKIVVSAMNETSGLGSQTFIVARSKEEDIDKPLATGASNPNAVAVVIGISKFKSSEIPGVDYARKDAETMKEYLVKALGFSQKNIYEFYDENATATELKSFFNTELINKITKPGESDVFVFYSGHGTPDTNTNEGYLVPYDFKPRDPKNTGFKAKDLYKNLEMLTDAKSVTVVLDTCFSGQTNDGKLLIKGASPMLIEVDNPVLNIPKGVVFSSSSGKQISSWYNKKRHGIFSYFFFQGLNGKADENNDGSITVKELENYLKTNVSMQARAIHNREQTPEVMGDRDKVLVNLR